jgi:hypothetical protein
LWFLEQLRPGTPTYNIAVLYRLRGPLDRDWLNRALTRVVDRHDVLRASFGAQDGTPFQTIAAPGPVTLAFDDLTGLPVDERDPAALRAAALEAAEPFDLRIGPLFRFRLIRIDAEHHLLSIVIHHIVSDGWSFGLFNAELSQAYEQLSRGEEFGTAASTSQYEDFVSAQRAAVRDDHYESQLTYWENQLRGLPVLDLTADRPRPVTRAVSASSSSPPSCARGCTPSPAPTASRRSWCSSRCSAWCSAGTPAARTSRSARRCSAASSRCSSG